MSPDISNGFITMIPINPPLADDGYDSDPLTKLPGMRSVLARISHWQSQAARCGEEAPIQAMLISLERFSALNLAFGRSVGDRALMASASRMTCFARQELGLECLVARITGNAFLVMVNEALSRTRWQWLAEELHCALTQPVEIPGDVPLGRAIRLVPRIALSRSTPGEEPHRIITRLAEALETSARPNGAVPIWVDGAVSPPGLGAAQLETDLAEAIKADRIEICYQPQYAARGDGLEGAEALARWRHDQVGRIGALGLFAIAERAGLAASLSRRIFRTALEEARGWPESVRLSLNVTAADLADRRFANRLCSTLNKAGFDPNRLTLEITEQELVRDLEASARSLIGLTDLGVSIALDDFGAGFCNFRYLKVLPLRYIKLDRCMVQDLAQDPRDLAVLRGIVAMAKALGLDVIAEGIENATQREMIEREGCMTWQGFLGSKPLSADAFRKLIAR